jgi:hypothetical protein
MLASIRSVIRSAWAICGYQRSMVASRSTLRSSASWSRIVTVNVFVMLPIGAGSLAVMRLRVAVSATPRAATYVRLPGIEMPNAAPPVPVWARPRSMAALIRARVAGRSGGAFRRELVVALSALSTGAKSLSQSLHSNSLSPPATAPILHRAGARHIGDNPQQPPTL